MLSKKICKYCYKKHAIEFFDVDLNTFDLLWSIGEKVQCPQTVAKQIIYMKTGRRKPVKHCPYWLEHVVDSQGKEQS